MNKFARRLVLFPFKLLTDKAWRREIRVRLLRYREFRDFERHNKAALQLDLRGKSVGAGPTKNALICCTGSLDCVKVELGLIKALEMAGFSTSVVLERNELFVKYYRLAGVKYFYFWDDYLPAEQDTTEKIIDRLESFEDLLSVEYAGARVGRISASTALRRLRTGSLDLGSPEIKQLLMGLLGTGIKYAQATKEIVRKAKPHLALFVDRGYTPSGECFETCLAEGVPAITWNAAHKSNTIMLKRYTLANRDEHPSSLSDVSWNELGQIEWSDTEHRRLRRELHETYACGDWYSEVGTQFSASMQSETELRERLKIPLEKKVAAIFPHIFWDGTFFWGTDLFSSYEEWFAETVRAACANDSVSWIIKVHPANIIKNLRDGVEQEPSELKILRQEIGKLPPHIFVIPADSNISTFSLYEIIDYCVTVRGTVGIEAASFGVPVLTAGTGRYDHKGFTIDSESRQEYLENLSRIQDIPRLSPAQHELAERFAYGVFLLRPLVLKTVTLEYQRDAKASLRTEINASSEADWLNAPDLGAIANWIASPDATDFMIRFASEWQKVT